jgi:L-proline amide hydrolase
VPPTFLREVAAGRAGGAIRRHETAGTFDDPEYGEAMDLFYRRYACRLDPWPD